MHIVFFEFVTNFGGARRSTIETAKRLAAHAQVTIVDAYGCCAQFGEAVREAGLPLRILKPQSARIVGGAGGGLLSRAISLGAATPDLLQVRWRLGRLLRELRPTVVTCNETKGMAVASRLGLCPVVGYMRGWYRRDMLVPYVRYVLRHRLDHLIAVSHATRAGLLSCGIPWERISVIQNPVDIDKLEARAARGLAMPLPQADRPIRLLLAANCLKEKGLHTAVRAVAELVKSGSNPVLYLAGGVPFSAPQDYVREVRNLSAELGVSERVEWLGARDDVPAVIRACTTVVLPTFSEGMPRIVLEAMALGVPVVATPVGGVLDLIQPTITGMLMEIEDASGLAHAVREIHADEVLRCRMTANAREFVACRLNTRRHTALMLDTLHSLSCR